MSLRYYLLPHINKETFLKELICLVDISVLTPVQQSKYGPPVFIIVNKEGTVGFLTKFRKSNKLIVQKSYPIPIVGDIMQQLEGLWFTTSLFLNLLYYIIQLGAKYKDLTTIVMVNSNKMFSRREW